MDGIFRLDSASSSFDRMQLLSIKGLPLAISFCSIFSQWRSFQSTVFCLTIIMFKLFGGVRTLNFFDKYSTNLQSWIIRLNWFCCYSFYFCNFVCHAWEVLSLWAGGHHILLTKVWTLGMCFKRNRVLFFFFFIYQTNKQ